MPDEIIMFAKFSGKCIECGYRIDEGATILYRISAKTARHKKCPEPSYDGTEQKSIFEMWVQKLEGKENG